MARPCLKKKKKKKAWNAVCSSGKGKIVAATIHTVWKYILTSGEFTCTFHIKARSTEALLPLYVHIYHYTYNIPILSPKTRIFINQSLTRPTWKTSCPPPNHVDAWLRWKGRPGAAAELRTTPAHFSGNDSGSPPNSLAASTRTSSKRPPLEAREKHFLPRTQKNLFHRKKSPNPPNLPLWNRTKKRVPARGGGKERSENRPGRAASSLGARPSLRPQAPGRSLPPARPQLEVGKAGSGPVNQARSPASRSPPPFKK